MRRRSGWTDRLRLILISALQVDKAVFFSVLIIVAAFVPLFTMQGVEGQIFGPMARTYGFALAGALIATFTVTPVLATYCCPSTSRSPRRSWCGGCTGDMTERCDSRWRSAGGDRHRPGVSRSRGVRWTRLGSEFLPHLDEGNLWIRAELPMTMSLEDGTRRPVRCGRSCCNIRRSSPSSRSTAGRMTAAMPHRSRMSSCSCRSSPRGVAAGVDQGPADRSGAGESSRQRCPEYPSTSRSTSRTTSRRRCRASKARTR